MLNLNISHLGFDVAEYFKSLNSTRIITSILALLIIIPIYRRVRCLRTPRLQGPRSQSFIFGNTKNIFPSTNLALVYQNWERTYGPVYEIPTGFGSSHVVLNDLKAITQLFSKDTTTYCLPARQKAVTRKSLGDIILAVEGETHKRLRKVLSPPLLGSAIRDLTSVCLDSAHQLKVAWDSYFRSPDKSNHGALIDVEKWMTSVTLDTIGKAILSHDFGALKGHASPILTVADNFHAIKPSLFIRLMLFITEILYKLFKVPLPNAKEQQLEELGTHFKVLTTDFLIKARKDPEGSDIHRSVLGVILKSENANSSIRLSLPEIIAQASVLVLAGSETTAILLTWSLIELSRRPEIQETLRVELNECLADGDPTYDQLTKDLKYLDAFISEILRLHPPSLESVRVADADDILPLTDPIRTASGAMIDSLFVRKGTVIHIPLGSVNISERLWGPDARIFDPGRWLDAEDHKKARRQKVPGYRNLLTFAAGPRLCPGRDLAVLKAKAILTVLVRHFAFEFPNGPSTEVSWQFGRPKVVVVGEDEPNVTLLVRRLT